MSSVDPSIPSCNSKDTEKPLSQNVCPVSPKCYHMSPEQPYLIWKQNGLWSTDSWAGSSIAMARQLDLLGFKYFYTSV